MSRTDLDSATLAESLRRMAGDGSVEWVAGPMQASVLLDIADILDENTKLRELVREMVLNMGGCALHGNPLRLREFGSRAIELGIEVDE